MPGGFEHVGDERVVADAAAGGELSRLIVAAQPQPSAVVMGRNAGVKGPALVTQNGLPLGPRGIAGGMLG